MWRIVFRFSFLSTVLLSFGLLTACVSTGETGGDAEKSGAVSSVPEKVDSWVADRQQILDGLAAQQGLAVLPGEERELLLRLNVGNGFAREGDKPLPKLAKLLDVMAQVLVAVPNTAVQVIGHTDSQGSEMYNLKLSIRRAEAVMEYLRQGGIELLRISAEGLGEAEPIADDRTIEGRGLNRRIEMRIRPL